MADWVFQPLQNKPKASNDINGAGDSSTKTSN